MSREKLGLPRQTAQKSTGLAQLIRAFFELFNAGGADLSKVHWDESSELGFKQKVKFTGRDRSVYGLSAQIR